MNSMFKAHHFLLGNRFCFMQYLFSQPLSLFSKAKTLNCLGPKDMLNCVECIYIVNTKYEGHGAGTTCLKLGQFWPISSAKNITVSRETSTFFLRNLSHVLTITDFLVFSPAEKNSGETRAEKSVCFPQATSSGLALQLGLQKDAVYLIRVNFEKEISVIYFRFTHLSWLS